MSLPASQRRALSQIEEALADDHPSLVPMFGIFAKLTGHQEMPATERVTARSWRWRWRMRPAFVTIVGLALAAGALLALSLTLSGPQMCATGTVVPVAAHARSAPTPRQPACAPPQHKPAKTSPAK
jgi:hypothetical protein